MTTTAVPLTQLRSGESAIIQGFSSGITPHHRKHLQHLGMIPKTLITLIRRAPLGDPLQLQILGSQFSIRASEACHIYVQHSN